MLKIHNLCKEFGLSKVLDNVNLTIQKSEIVGLAGASGEGKSTLLRCIYGLETFSSGYVECSGKIGFMFQDFQLFPHMNVMNNVLYAPKLQKRQSKDNKNREENLHSKSTEILGTLGILAKADEYPHNLSGGQKQRAALARSLMMNPDVLLCDEPTSGLDIAGIDDVITLLKSVQKNFATTMVIASHNVDFLDRVSDRIIILKGGKISENGDQL